MFNKPMEIGMKVRFSQVTSLVMLVLAGVFIYGCFKIFSVSQPSTIKGKQQFTAQVVVTVEGTSDATPHYGIFSILLPTDWTVDSVWYTGGYTGACAFLPADSADAEKGGKVDYWTNELETRYPAASNMHWVTYQSDSSNAVRTDTVPVTVNVKMTPSVKQGTFNLGYFATDAALDFTDPSYFDIKLDNNITVSGVVAVDNQGPQKAEAFSLLQNYPNPFNPSTSIRFGLPVESNVTLSVYNTSGKLENVISSGKYSAGMHNVSFDASALPSGIYYYTLNALGSDGTTFNKTGKMLLLK